MHTDIGTFLLMLALAYYHGVLWYDLLPGKLPLAVWRTAAHPFAGMFVAETLAANFAADPKFGGIHLISAFVGSLIAVIVDWIITSARQPSVVRSIERGVESAAAHRA